MGQDESGMEGSNCGLTSLSLRLIPRPWQPRARVFTKSQPESSPKIDRIIKRFYLGRDGTEAEQALEGFAQAWSDKCDHRQAVAIRFVGRPGRVNFPTRLQGNLHDRRHRIGQQCDSRIHTEPQAIPQRGVGMGRVPGDPRGVQEMDDADPKLETSLNHFAIIFENRLPAQGRN